MNWLRRFMYGRNGPDQLSLAVLGLGAAVLIAAQLARLPLLSAVYYLCAFLFFFRTLSRNIYQRRRENMRFMTILNKIKNWFKLRGRMIREVRTFRYLRCPKCRQRLRVPKGKGKINIRCNGCGEQFIEKV